MSMIFVNFQVFAGMAQILAALVCDLHGVKFKYLLFSPIYLLFTWIVNPLTIITTFIKAVKTALGYRKGTWKSPKRMGDSEK